MSEKPCEKCDQWEDEYSRQKCYVREVQAGMTADTCGLLAHGMGHQEGYAVGESERDALRAEVERLVGLVMELTDAGECWYDHHGLCQAHSLQERPCPHSRAKDLLKAKGALSGAGKEEK
jgi:hypothetical protein